MPLQIPPHHHEPLKRLYELVADDAVPLIELLEGLPAFLSTPELQSSIAALLPTDADAQGITLAIVSLSTQSSRWTADELGRHVSDSPDLGVPEEGRGPFAAVLAKLVQTRVLETTAKAVSILSHHERLFHDARIMSDVRPIFGDDPSERPTGAVVVHTLSIDHHTEGTIKTFNVAMDRNDLVELMATVDRAIRKASVLPSVVEAAGLALFELEEAEE